MTFKNDCDLVVRRGGTFLDREEGLALTDYLMLLGFLTGGVVVSVLAIGSGLNAALTAWSNWFEVNLATVAVERPADQGDADGSDPVVQTAAPAEDAPQTVSGDTSGTTGEDGGSAITGDTDDDKDDDTGPKGKAPSTSRGNPNPKAGK